MASSVGTITTNTNPWNNFNRGQFVPMCHVLTAKQRLKIRLDRGILISYRVLLEAKTAKMQKYRYSLGSMSALSISPCLVSPRPQTILLSIQCTCWISMNCRIAIILMKGCTGYHTVVYLHCTYVPKLERSQMAFFRSLIYTGGPQGGFGGSTVKVQ